MCGETNRPTFGGTIAVIFPRENRWSSNDSNASLSSSPESVSSFASSSSTASMSSYSLFFRETDATTRKTRAIFRTEDTETYRALRECRNVDMRIDAPLYQFSLNMEQDKSFTTANSMDIEFELPERLDLGVSEKGVIGRQVTVREEGGSILGVGVVGYN
ncbi:unnamed protein product [Penicillium glandicola]